MNGLEHPIRHFMWSRLPMLPTKTVSFPLVAGDGSSMAWTFVLSDRASPLLTAIRAVFVFLGRRALRLVAASVGRPAGSCRWVWRGGFFRSAQAAGRGVRRNSRSHT